MDKATNISLLSHLSAVSGGGDNRNTTNGASLNALGLLILGSVSGTGSTNTSEAGPSNPALVSALKVLLVAVCGSASFHPGIMLNANANTNATTTSTRSCLSTSSRDGENEMF